MIDGRDIAKMRDEWLKGEEGKQCQSGVATGIYLQNRLESAFIAGVHAAEKLLKEKAGK